MNILKGTIEEVTTRGSLSLVQIKVGQTHLSSIMIINPESSTFIKTGNTVNVIFKETEVIIGKGTEHLISLQNKLIGRIRSVESSNLLSKLILDTKAGDIVSIITTKAINQLQLQKGSEITAMIKTNEIMLSE